MGVTQERFDSGISRPKLYVSPPVLEGIAFGAQVLLSRRHSSSAGSRFAGILIGCVAVLVDVGAGLEFRRNNTTMDPKTLDATKLVRTGPYKLTRNPMYLCATGRLVAYAVARRSWLALLPAALYAIIIDRIQIPVEEAALERRFGVEYDHYRAATPRWLGCGS